MKKRSFLQNLLFFKFFDKNGIGSIPRIFISSLIIIFTFYLTPLFFQYLNEGSQEFQNNSKAVLAYTLKNDGVSNGKEEVLDERDYQKKLNGPYDVPEYTYRLDELQE